MAKREQEPPQKGPPTVKPQKGLELLTRQIEKGNAVLANRPIAEGAESGWTNITRDFIEKAFGANSEKIYEVFPRSFVSFAPDNADERYWEGRRAERIAEALGGLKALVEVLQTEVELSEDSAASSALMSAATSPISRKVFIVHGHDGETKLAAARFLESLHLDVTILHEKPNEGKTIIEKFEHHADVGFAIVLLTADDRGGSKSQSLEAQRLRARQNVIFELGYFIGRLGRAKVCALYESGVELPTDISGVVYVALDAGGAWRFALADELHAAGFDIDYNLLRKRR